MQFLNPHLPPNPADPSLTGAKSILSRVRNQEQCLFTLPRYSLTVCGVPKPAWRCPGTHRLPLQAQVLCKRLGACSFSIQILAQVETLLLLSHPQSRMATGRDADGEDGMPCSNSPGSAGMGVSFPWVGCREVSKRCARQAWLCLGRRGEHAAWALPPAAAGAWRVTGFYLPFSLLPGWLASSGPQGGVVLWAATCNSQYLALEMQQRCKPWLHC